MIDCFLLRLNRYGDRNCSFNLLFICTIIEHTHREAEKIKCGQQ